MSKPSRTALRAVAVIALVIALFALLESVLAGPQQRSVLHDVTLAGFAIQALGALAYLRASFRRGQADSLRRTVETV
jgi:hypothetical protein